MEPVDRHFIDTLTKWAADPPEAKSSRVQAEYLARLFDAQARSRLVDFAARELQAAGRGFYTISSAGHEANAAVAMALRPTDPALLHYRSGAFYTARAMQVERTDPVADLLASVMSSTTDPISAGRHKVIGHPKLAILPQTSTIASHLPRAVGMAFTLDRGVVESPWPDDAIVVASLGDASANHSTAVGAFNAAGYLSHQGVPLPLLVVCEDNGIGISVRSPSGWTARTLANLPGVDYLYVDGSDVDALAQITQQAVDTVRARRRPLVVHLKTVRFMGHAGSDVELAYRSATEIQADYAHDPLVATAKALLATGSRPAGAILARYEQLRAEVGAASQLPASHLESAAQVMAPLAYPRNSDLHPASPAGQSRRLEVFDGEPPDDAGGLTLAQSINATLSDLMAADPGVLVFGEDVARKGGVYGVTRGLQARFGIRRVFDTLLDEQTVLGTALGAAVCGALPIAEIQYLAYLHNAEDQLRGEAATLGFFSAGQYQNGMIVRIAGLAYQRGFGGHFHNDNSLAVLRDIPGIVVGVPASAADAPGMLRTMAALARQKGRVCVLVEPIALYHSRDLHPGDGAWVASYDVAATEPEFGVPRIYREGELLPPGREHEVLPTTASTLVVTFGNGVPMSLRARDRAAADGVRADVLDLRWLHPLPVRDLVAQASKYGRVLIADETRRSGGVAESVIATLVDHGYQGQLIRLNSEDSIIPLGPAAATVLLNEDQIYSALMNKQENVT
ncbi:MAG TPA: thiamine pyrophosphate-dependent enzyme [Marmoricola sp.]|nr:thiamine pyrophosphate-dependent enzyme [Marmoricola sp.]